MMSHMIKITRCDDDTVEISDRKLNYRNPPPSFRFSASRASLSCTCVMPSASVSSPSSATPIRYTVGMGISIDWGNIESIS